MVKNKTIYVCQNCGSESTKWSGQCPSCGGWNTLEETLAAKVAGNSKNSTGNLAHYYYLNAVDREKFIRIDTGIGEFNRVLGGGLVPGQVILLAGDPGIGKSTLLTQLSKSMTAKIEKNIGYVCGEESPSQIKIRAERLAYDSKSMLVLSDTNVENIIETLRDIYIKDNIGLIIVDSIQTLSSNDLTGVAGSVGQVRLCAQRLASLAKSIHIPVILVGHVTKEGTVAGPKVLEHLVDTVVYLEGDTQHLYRVLKTTKNRFGAVSEVGIFEMRDTGLIEVLNPSKIFLSNSSDGVPGSCVTVVMEGQRPLLFEVQALTTPTAFGYPRRTTSGFNTNRLQVLIAILEKRCKLKLGNLDVYINIAGGFKINEYACDLAVCLAIVSSVKNVAIKSDVVAFGECGLLGEIRNVANIEKRIKEAKKMGYNSVISPESTKFVNEAIKKCF